MQTIQDHDLQSVKVSLSNASSSLPKGMLVVGYLERGSCNNCVERATTDAFLVHFEKAIYWGKEHGATILESSRIPLYRNFLMLCEDCLSLIADREEEWQAGF